MLRNIKKIALIALSLTAVMPAAAQDLLANQAPIDRKMRAVDSIQLNQMLESEVASQSPAAQLYDDWNNIYAHRQTSLPDSFLIDLRGFAMPSPSTVITSNFGPRWGRQHKGLDIKLNDSPQQWPGDHLRTHVKAVGERESGCTRRRTHRIGWQYWTQHWLSPPF